MKRIYSIKVYEGVDVESQVDYGYKKMCMKLGDPAMIQSYLLERFEDVVDESDRIIIEGLTNGDLATGGFFLPSANAVLVIDSFVCPIDEYAGEVEDDKAMDGTVVN